MKIEDLIAAKGKIDIDAFQKAMDDGSESFPSQIILSAKEALKHKVGEVTLNDVDVVKIGSFSINIIKSESVPENTMFFTSKPLRLIDFEDTRQIKSIAALKLWDYDKP